MVVLPHKANFNYWLLHNVSGGKKKLYFLSSLPTGSFSVRPVHFSFVEEKRKRFMAAERTRLTSQRYYSGNWRQKCVLLFMLGPSGEFRKHGSTAFEM